MVSTRAVNGGESLAVRSHYVFPFNSFICIGGGMNMKDTILFMLFIVAANFFFKGEPSLYDLLHERAIEAVSKKENT